MWIVKIPKDYRTDNDMAKYVGLFTTFNEAEEWVKSTFKDSWNYKFKYSRVDKP